MAERYWKLIDLIFAEHQRKILKNQLNDFPVSQTDSNLMLLEIKFVVIVDFLDMY